MPKRKIIMEKALEFSEKGGFKASKGWCDKFMKRNRAKIDKWKTGAKKTSGE